MFSVFTAVRDGLLGLTTVTLLRRRHAAATCIKGHRDTIFSNEKTGTTIAAGSCGCDGEALHLRHEWLHPLPLHYCPFILLVISDFQTMDYFSVIVHHSGKFKGKVGRGQYVDGEKEIVDWCDRDKWSLLEVYDMLEKLGYLEENIDSLWYKNGGLGLKKLCVDRDAMELANIGYIDVGGGVNVGDEADCGPSVDLEAQDVAETGPSVGVEAHNSADCGPNVILEAQNIEVEIQGVDKIGVKNDRVGQCAEDNVDIEGDSDDEDDPDYEEDLDLYFSNSEDDFCGDDALFDVVITLGNLQQEIKDNKQAKAKKAVKKKGKETVEVRISSGLSDDKGINSDES
ncbi:hypothetical protein PIB30_100767 [Stylosanthes scabra]|uniref:PB1-like domain-containing protein n=1 Tax=Stylosanthes scabra TaxID=79078 RepID=A0ABU6RXP8_9FABA|nr:hypothetical protein [Stylosanthes scabra]